jgi:hypothetical protein
LKDFLTGFYCRRLNKVANYLNRVTLVNATSERNLFTRHGLHMNVRGKEAMSKKSAVIIHDIVDECNKNDTIPMTWKDDSLKYSDEGRETDVNYLIENKNKIKLNMIMNTYNLEQVVDFPTRIFKDKVSQFDNIFQFTPYKMDYRIMMRSFSY